jgi:hypothetical protein
MKLFRNSDFVLRISFDTNLRLVSKVSHPGKNHGDIVFIGSSDDLIISDRSSGLDDCYGARLRPRIHAIPEREHRIGGQHRSLR